MWSIIIRRGTWIECDSNNVCSIRNDSKFAKRVHSNEDTFPYQDLHFELLTFWVRAMSSSINVLELIEPPIIMLHLAERRTPPFIFSPSFANSCSSTFPYLSHHHQLTDRLNSTLYPSDHQACTDCISYVRNELNRPHSHPQPLLPCRRLVISPSRVTFPSFLNGDSSCEWVI